MSKKSLLDAVDVQKPCTEDWDKMFGTSKIRFCSHCAKDVNDLSAMTRKEAMRLIRASGGNICVRYIRDPKTKRPVFAGQMLQITRRAPGIAAGVMTASIALSTQAYAQSEQTQPLPVPVAVEKVIKVDNVNKPADTTTGRQIVELPINPDAVITMGVMASTVRVEYKNPLTTAVEDRNVDLVRDLIARGTNVRTSEDDGTTPLAVAVEMGDLQLVQILLDAGARVNAVDKSKQTPLMRLDEDATPELAETLIRAGANVSSRDKENNTPLMHAARSAKAEVLKALIDAGADVKAVNKDGETALMMAANDDDLEKVRMLVLAGADVNAKDKEGRTAWDRTSESEIEDLLVSFGAIVEDSSENIPMPETPAR